jgi:magnesium chelatase subunit D
MLNNIPPSQSDTLLQGLACAVLNPELRTILVYDAPWYGLQQITDYLQILAEASGQEIQRAQLGSSEHEDDLWGSFWLPNKIQDAYRTWQQARLFSPERAATATQLILIPDLTTISLAVARACIMQMDADVVHLERQNQSAHWRPRQYWIAGCDTDHIGMVSPHILDRFTLRLAWQEMDALTGEQTRTRQLQQLLHAPQEQRIKSIDVDQEIITALQHAPTYQPEITSDALMALKDYLPPTPNEDTTPEPIYHRREIALARYAFTLAQFTGSPTMERAHIEQAAALLNIRSQIIEDSLPDVSTIDEQFSRKNNDQEQIAETNKETPQTDPQPGSNSLTLHTEEHEISKPETTITQLQKNVVIPEMTYLEDSDNTPIERDEASLRLPLRRTSTGRADRGPIIGIEPSNTLRDIAIVSTLLQASLFQPARRSRQTNAEPVTGPGLKITQEDLRRYRRAPVPEHMLLLLLDYTSLHNCNWQEALLPYLSQAYIDRAHITIIKVGAQNPRSEFQAEIISERKILVPGVEQALLTPAGRATPLAHGLYLTQQTLQKNIQHGRSTIARVTFVVISDGRGNVPLEVSMLRKPAGCVTREGIADALIQARHIRTMKHIHTILLNPQPTAYPHLPILLAEALDAEIIDLQTDQQIKEETK